MKHFTSYTCWNYTENEFSLTDLQTCLSPEYRLLTALIFATAGCEYVYTCGRESMCMCFYECMCRCVQFTVKWRTGNINWACCASSLLLLHHLNTVSVTFHCHRFSVWDDVILSQVGGFDLIFCRGNSRGDLFSLQVPLWIGGRGKRFYFHTQQLGHFNKAPIFESLSSDTQENMRMKEKQRRHH